MRQWQRGMTLVELLIATAILAVLAVLATTLLNTSLENQQQLKEASEGLEELSIGFTLMQRDLEQMVNRPGRDMYGDRQSSGLLSFAEGDQFLLEFTRNGRRQLPGESVSSSLERIRYAIEDDRLIRYSAAVPDPVSNTDWRKQSLIKNISSVSFGFFDGGTWQRQWPREDSRLVDSVSGLPEAVSIRVETSRWGVVELIALVAADEVTDVLTGSGNTSGDGVGNESP